MTNPESLRRDGIAERIEAIRQRAEAATPGPWPMPDALSMTPSGRTDFYDPRRPIDHEGCSIWPWSREEDMAFAYHAREDIPYLLAQLAAATARVAVLEDVLWAVEWGEADERGDQRCPECDGIWDQLKPDRGHKLDCPVRAALS